MANSEKRAKPQTLVKYQKYNRIGKALNVGVFAAPFIPASIVTIVNWGEWFGKCGLSLPLGLSSLLVTVVLALLGILKSDTVLKKKDIVLFYIALILIFAGVSCLFLASLNTTLGFMFIYVASGVLASGVVNAVNNHVVAPKKEFYKRLVEENGLDARSKEKQKAERLAREEAEELARQEAEEGVDLT